MLAIKACHILKPNKVLSLHPTMSNHQMEPRKSHSDREPTLSRNQDSLAENCEKPFTDLFVSV